MRENVFVLFGKEKELMDKGHGVIFFRKKKIEFFLQIADRKLYMIKQLIVPGTV